MTGKILSFRRKAKPVGQTLEKGREEQERREARRKLLVKIVIFALLLVLTFLAFPQGAVYQYTVSVGDTWRQETLEAPIDFPLYKTEAMLDAERQSVRERTPPFFAPADQAEADLEQNAQTVGEQLSLIFESYGDYLLNRSRGRMEEARQDSTRFAEFRRNARLKLTPNQWDRLLDDYLARVPGLNTETREAPSERRLDEQLLADALGVSKNLLDTGVHDLPSDSISADQIRIRNDESNEVFVQSSEGLFGTDDAYLLALNSLGAFYPDNPELTAIAGAMFQAIFVPNLRYLRAETYRAWQEAENRITPVYGKVSEGDVIVQEGQMVTDDIKAQLLSLERIQGDEGSAEFLWRRSLGQFLLILGTYAIFFLYLFILRRHIFDDNRRILPIALLFAVLIGLFAAALRTPEFIDAYLVPVAIAPLLLTVMFDSRVGLFATLTLGFLGGMLLNYDFEFAFATVFAGTLGVFSVRDVKNRGQFFVSSGVIFLGYVFVLTASYFFQQSTLERYGLEVLYAAGNAFLVLMAYPLLWFFEKAFDITTDLTLLELSNTNRPLLKELSVKAPGSFNHSLQVANLSEAAADRIGANALLARVGALYHDIGKMSKPEYYVENQRPGFNPHDQLKPRMSALIIASHVKEGMEMGRKAGLPERVLNFIPTHHGTTRIEYFYRKAVEQADDDALVQDAEFRYPGPRPNSKETGILMLADSVEAASRSLAEPTHKRLETLLDMIFKARTEDGQLSDTDLTFRELDQIRETFLSVLMGIYHVRVKYPGQDQEEQETETNPTSSETTASEAIETHEAPALTGGDVLEQEHPESAPQPQNGAPAPFDGEPEVPERLTPDR